MNFFNEVYKVVGKIPKGKVATYGQVASMVSTPRAARIVGYALRELSANSNLPWQRVINREGRVSIENLQIPQEVQIERLQNDGIEVNKKQGSYFVDLEKYLWQP